MDLIRLDMFNHLNVCYIFEQILKGFEHNPDSRNPEKSESRRTKSRQPKIPTTQSTDTVKIPTSQNPDTTEIQARPKSRQHAWDKEIYFCQ